MFRHYKPERDVGQGTLCKSSAIRAIKQSICDIYPSIEPHIDDILPKKEGVSEVKITPGGPGSDKHTLICANGEAMFFRARDGPYIPSMRLLHKYPLMMQKLQVDTGGIKFVLKGADVMCPGLTSAGGSMPAGLPGGCPVAVYAQGKEHAMAVGILKMSVEDV